MLIDVSDERTIPIGAEQKILERFTSMQDSVISRLKAKKIKYGHDVTCAIENYIGPGSAYDFYQELILLFNQYQIVCYHSTKILDRNRLLSGGLKTNEWDTYSQNIADTLRKLGVGEGEVAQSIEVIKRHYDWKYPLYDREPQLCFYSDTGMLSEGMSAGYEKFCENIGGELAQDALKTDYPKLYKYLRENGEALLVKFKIPFSNIKEYNQDSIIFQFVAYFAGKYFWNYDYKIHFDGNTDKAIPEDDILELIPYTVDRYYFKE